MNIGLLSDLAEIIFVALAVPVGTAMYRWGRRLENTVRQLKHSQETMQDCLTRVKDKLDEHDKHLTQLRLDANGRLSKLETRMDEHHPTGKDH